MPTREPSTTSLSAATLRAVAAAYDLIDARVVGVFQSKRNDVFKLDSGGRSVVARRLRPRPGLEVRLGEQHAFVSYLARSGFPAIPPLPTVDGTTFASIGGDVYDVYPFVEGERVKPPDKAHVVVAARALGVYHNLTDGYPQTGMMKPNLREQFLKRVGHFSSLATAVTPNNTSANVRASLEYLTSALPEIEVRMQELDYEQLPRVMVHGDYHFGNLLFRSNELVAVLDFDSSRPDARAIDMVIALLSLTRREPGLDPVFLDGFVTSYTNVIAVDDAEWRALPVLVEAYIAYRAVRELHHVRDSSRHDRRSASRRVTRLIKRLRWLRASREWRSMVEALPGE